MLKPYITQNEVETKTVMDLKGAQRPVLLKNLLLFKENVVSSTPQSCLSGHEPSFVPTPQLKPEEKLLRNPVLKDGINNFRSSYGLTRILIQKNPP